MTKKCSFHVPRRPYSPPGRCQAKYDIKPVLIREGGDLVNVLGCLPHRKMVAENKRVELAR